MPATPASGERRLLEGRVALVTGSAGDRTRNPRDLAAAGARVMAVSRTEADLISLHAEIGGAYLASR